MNFDRKIDWQGRSRSTWESMESAFGVSPADGIPMWIADMDFEPAPFLLDKVRDLADKGHFGYFTGVDSYRRAVAWWLSTRHGWEIDPDWVVVTAGLGNGIAMTLHALTEPGDEVIMFSPVYHEFRMKVKRAGRVPREFPLVRSETNYELDFDSYERMLSGRERVVLFSSPHNPGGRIWTEAELAGLAAFCERHDLILISDEIHHDIIFPGQRHTITPLAAPKLSNRLITMTSASKVFNLAGMRTGNVIIEDADMRARLSGFMDSINLQPNLCGIKVCEAAFSPEGAEWVDQLCPYIAGNARFFEDAVARIPGVTATHMQATYLAWLDFSGTGMEMEEVRQRVYGTAKLCPTPGIDLGPGGETCLRFNLGAPRSVIEEAASRLADAFSDLQ
ncbi:aminotransferase class I/II-fold pyridoxal phosphate-dependent enzyme [Ponticoccus sp. SC2-23]|uniref:MalY/PatB family protein n=1 Tax=Alexandriicola marinus TaxID=2081710 RepID=UPI000FDC076F|nr:aminotransferase class I/II-fold pyridoxal phosphate-dependent enzyme [Alexandriicola marinus]MBM1221968.1 aminotransferase class I/II-fold pyridoxal phosphate-dependent enzyme [Ponticoccus sp. SC6-9]MBM1226319.1 aminotransferase class I/II-fold pyridoxal phosphate-dependent enzyme [Ponticoccus sp. SC6-15]MBM1230915.1 aminotransferase class I/II-fold pyridoxal phosphate-dependent enzyme [Ponticoccus sp. SC6-38]MBM1235244.1 aminotransferase class I/II-fold pyridoxal phosphate-dependent enzyme